MKPQIENPGAVFKRLIKFLFSLYGKEMIAVFICIIISVLASLQGTMFMQVLIDDYIIPMVETGSTDFGPLIKAITKTAIFYSCGIFATYGFNRIMVNVTQGTLLNLRGELFEHMETLPIRYFDSNARGDIMSIYTNDIDTMRQMISQSIPSLFQSMITLAGVVVCMIIRSVPLTIVSFIMVGFMLKATMKISSKSGTYFMAQQKDIGKVNGYIEEMMTGQKVVKVFCHEEESIKQFDELNDQLFDSAYNANKYANILMPTMAQMGNLSYVICVVIGAILIMTAVGVKGCIFPGIAPLTVGGLFAFLQFNKSLNMPISSWPLPEQTEYLNFWMRNRKRMRAMLAL